MLLNLQIKNYALIEELILAPSSQFNIITGETGAGKSILLGALSLLMGDRADSKMLRSSSVKCVVEGSFDIQAYKLKDFFLSEELDYDELTTIRREINASGKSRAFINDTPVTLSTLKALTSQLIDIHSQYDTLLLAKPMFQLDILDVFANNLPLRNTYNEAFRHYKEATNRYKGFLALHNEAQRSLDYHEFLFNELQEAGLKQGEQDQLSTDLQLLENAEALKDRVSEALQGLDRSEWAINKQLAVVQQCMQKLAELSDRFSPLHERLISCLIELQDMVGELENANEDLILDPNKLEDTRSRLDLIYRLHQKHGVETVEELLKIQDKLELKVQSVVSREEEISLAKDEMDKAGADLLVKAKRLSQARKDFAPRLIKDVETLLRQLGMPDAKLVVEFSEVTPNDYGIDALQFCFSANKGVAPQPLKYVASGGEFARLMLCFKFIVADKTALPTIIFDEIDTGISGEVALKMANMLEQMSQNHQVIAITHLPQMAAKGDRHYWVHKEHKDDLTVTKLKQLNDAERTVEIAKMISGNTPSPHALASAKELLDV